MEFARYLLALFLLMALPCAILYWFIIHPFAKYWRKWGATKTQAFCSVVLLGVCVAVFMARDFLLQFDWGIKWILIGIGTAVLVIGIYFEYRCRIHLKLSTLLGGPELSPDRFPNQILDQGIYAQVRHPRYLAASFGCIGVAMILNYPAIYIFTISFVILLYPVILFEERELRERFGAQYEQYAKNTPRIVPKWRIGKSN